MKDVRTLISEKMRARHLSDAAIRAFLHSVDELSEQREMLVRESEILPVPTLPEWDELVAMHQAAGAELLSKTVVIKLNGGLGTSMGLRQAKSLLEIKPGVTFLDLIVKQVETLRRKAKCSAQLLLMNSFSTTEDTMHYLQKYAELGYGDAARVQLMQNMVPKLMRDSLEPVHLPRHPELEWCPPGHGDLYAALAGSGKLEQLLTQGVIYAFISNCDNLGAQLDPRFLSWFAQSGAPFVMEATTRTAADKKGGHLALRKSDGQLMLREVAQCDEADLDAFQDISRHRFFNTNNLWIRLDVLHDFMASHGGMVPLPVIRNAKTADPRDPNSPPVYQLETAMGAALQCFPGAQAINVPRSRFFPVKTTGDLLILRSDAVEIDAEGNMKLAPECNGIPPIVQLSPDYKLVDSLSSLGVPSLKNVHHLTVRGPWKFSPNQPLKGDVSVG